MNVLNVVRDNSILEFTLGKSKRSYIESNKVYLPHFFFKLELSSTVHLTQRLGFW